MLADDFFIVVDFKLTEIQVESKHITVLAFHPFGIC